VRRRDLLKAATAAPLFPAATGSAADSRRARPGRAPRLGSAGSGRSQIDSKLTGFVFLSATGTQADYPGKSPSELQLAEQV